MKIILLSLLIVLGTVSCKISQQYHFNADYSGSYSMDFDITALAEFTASSPDSIEDFFAEMDLDSIVARFDTLQGISNVRVTKAQNILHIAYDFAGLEALNTSLNTADVNDLQLGDAAEKFRVVDGVFRYDIGDFGETPSDSLAEVMSFIEYDIMMTFAQEIETASTGTIQSDQQTVVMNGNFGDVVRNEKQLTLEVTFIQDENKQRK